MKEDDMEDMEDKKASGGPFPAKSIDRYRENNTDQIKKKKRRKSEEDEEF